MPYTIGQIATQLGVSKPYVKKMLVVHGLFDGHTTAEGGRGTIYVDDEATKAVSHYITQELAKRTARPDLDAILPDVEDDGSDASGSQQDGELVVELRKQVALLEARLAKADADQQRFIDQLDRADAIADERVRDVRASYEKQMAALPSADAVEDARQAGRDEEREKIANMGFFKRMRYLRG